MDQCTAHKLYANIRYHISQSPTAMTDKKTDAVGPSFLPKEKARSEESERARYVGVFTKLLLLQGPFIAWSLYFITKFVSSEASLRRMETKFELLREYELYYVYWAMFMIVLVRLVLNVNANGARAPTRLNRPDQHIYQVVGKPDLVLMANEGEAGRFNRAQRGLFNMDEGAPLMGINTLLVSFVFGPLVCFFLVPVYAYGRIKFAHDYKKDSSSRTGAFLYCMIGEHGMAALLLLIAIKSTLGPLIPF